MPRSSPLAANIPQVQDGSFSAELLRPLPDGRVACGFGPSPCTASSRHLESFNGPEENDLSFSNISRLIPNVTNLFNECLQAPVNITEWQNEVGDYITSFYQKLRNATLLPGGGNVTVVRLANGSLSIVNGNVTVSPTGQLIINGGLTTMGSFNGTLSLNQTRLPNITSVATSILQKVANLTGSNSTLGSLIGGILGGDPPVPDLNATGVDLPSIVFSPSLLSNTTQLLSYSPVTPDAIMLQYFQNLTAAALAAIAPGTPARAESGPLNLNRTPAPPEAASTTSRELHGGLAPGSPDIKVYFFVIVAVSTDRAVTYEILANQIAKMNEHFGALGPFSRFVLAAAVRITNPDWVDRDPDTDQKVLEQMQSQTRIGGPQELNVWITTFSVCNDWNGYAQSPWYYQKYPKSDGIVLSKYTLPMESTHPNYRKYRSLGITATHETGHWPLPHLRYPIENFMDYGLCRRTFTAGQITAMKENWPYYRYYRN
ncbi:hypothetical protein KFL_001210230 [Klebsormidium nitens]|uniref:Uncharacterized protein n=1 Tax=Klebsormidium nitens TaxID=105231 RepID=A0A1Y1HZX7_KLENI|nr:hypothetical protein KFL_001210230 [Klebsormidium nitens]|eukprot:GAQ82729.1 hypothetical protein KFL_001210230 [Klebsormidium nitens]